ncbi:hypothetical protein J3R30DRAFT_3480404 [Lentinula aciculospora]|uniref:Uncharacterized protein n=1 Tax=Lentinula aciculospora TaxID=153920 RepID=A0A9W9DNP5_9AGAR|nr:hypothetical protein J3R30DRAFT_3480404 [Lentinula aciculospora]
MQTMLFDQLDTDPRPPSPELRFCHWGSACTRSFLSGKRLLQHIIVTHVRTAVPIYHDQIPILLRTTEGIGESYETEHFLSPGSRSRKGGGGSKEVKNHSQSSADSGPAGSLPSPPVSSSSHHQHGGDDESLRSGSESPQSQARYPSPLFYEDVDPNDFPAQPSNVLLSDALEPPSPGFAVLDAPSGSPRPGSIPPSPSFSDILASSTQKGTAKPHSPIPSRLLAHTLSSNSSSSENSCFIVEEQLTPADVDFSFEEERDGPSGGLSIPTAAESNQNDRYRGELKWDLSQTSTSQQATGSESTSLHQVPSGVVRDYGNVKPRRLSPQAHGVQDLPLQLPISSPLPSFEARGVARKQSWYGPTARPRKRSRGNNLSSSVSPVNSPAISPHGNIYAATTGTRFALNQNSIPRIRNDPSHSLHKMRGHDSSADSNNFNAQLLETRRTMIMQHPGHNDDCDADVSQMQEDTQLTMSPPIRQFSTYGNGMYDYPVQTQAPYDSQS